MEDLTFVGLEMKKDMPMILVGQLYIEIVYMVECLIIIDFLKDKKMEHIGFQLKQMFQFDQDGIITLSKTTKLKP